MSYGKNKFLYSIILTSLCNSQYDDYNEYYDYNSQNPEDYNYDYSEDLDDYYDLDYLDLNPLAPPNPPPPLPIPSPITPPPPPPMGKITCFLFF